MRNEQDADSSHEEDALGRLFFCFVPCPWNKQEKNSLLPWSGVFFML